MKKILILLSIVLVTKDVKGQNFDRTYYHGETVNGMAIISYFNHYIAGGINLFSTPGGQDTLSAFVQSVDSLGNTIQFYRHIKSDSLYFATFGGSTRNYFWHGCKGEDGNSYWTGWSSSDSAVFYYQADLYIVKLDSMGNTLWQKRKDAPNDSTYNAFSIKYNSKNGRIVTCGHTTLNLSNRIGLIMEIDTAGNVLRNIHPNVGMSYGFIDVIAYDTMFVGVGYKRVTPYDIQPIAMGISNSGQVLWTYYFPPQIDVNMIPSVDFVDSTYFVFYWVNSVKLPGSPWVAVHHLCKMDIYGNLIWDIDEFYSFNSAGRIKHLDNGNIMFSGNFKDTLGGNNNGYLVMFDSSGSILWDRKFAPWLGFFWFRDGTTTEDGGFIMTGEISSQFGNSYDLWIVKTDSLGLITSTNTIDPPALVASHLSIPYPNPSSYNCSVNAIIPPGIEKARLHVFDISGREINTITLNAGLNQLNIDVSTYSDGTYLLALSLNGYKDDVQKMVVRK